jgi:DNA (cytosine-5)-methyltransferase 1
VHPAGEPLRTLTTAGLQSVVEYDSPAVEDCLFWMLEPHEIGDGMALTPSSSCSATSASQLGNAVTPPAERELVATLAESDRTRRWRPRNR